VTEKTHNYFYKITNLVNGKYYYGIHSTNNLEDGYIGSGSTLLKAIKKYGRKNFIKEIISDYPTRKEASEHEKVVVNMELVRLEECYNLKTGGYNECVMLVSEETKKKHRERLRSKHTLESKSKISESSKGKKHSTVSILKMQSSKKLMSIETKIKIGESKKGNTYRKGVLHSKHTKKKISDKLTGENHVRSIGCIVDGVNYPSCRQAALILNVDHKTVIRRINSMNEKWKNWSSGKIGEYVT